MLRTELKLLVSAEDPGGRYPPAAWSLRPLQLIQHQQQVL